VNGKREWEKRKEIEKEIKDGRMRIRIYEDKEVKGEERFR
jgi:hypothetical protein